MDAVRRAGQGFVGALEGFLSCEGDDERGEALLNDASSAIDLMDSFSSSESWKPELAGWIEVVTMCWSNVVDDHLGVKVARHLDLVAPNLCAAWLDALKKLAVCVTVARNLISNEEDRQESVLVKEVSVEGGVEEGSEGAFSQQDEGDVIKRFSGEGVSDSLLKSVWPELKERGGLSCGRWRARVAAVELVSFLAVGDIRVTKWRDSILSLLEDLLQALVFGLALGDTQWQVRCAVVVASTRILEVSYGFLSDAIWTSLTWGLLAVCVDPQPEVQAAATDSLLHHLLPSSSKHTEMAVQRLLDRFISIAVAAAEGPEYDFDHVKGAKTVLAAVNAAVLLQLLPHQSAFEVQEVERIRIDRVPLLVVAASVALADAENKGENVVAANLLQLLRSLGSYHASLLAMLDPMMPLYECANLSSYCNKRGVIDEDTTCNLRKVPIVTVLKGLAAALESTTTTYNLKVIRGSPSLADVESLGNKQLSALQHIAEVLVIPTELTRNYKEKETDAKVTNYLVCGKLFLSMALGLIKKQDWAPSQAWEKENFVLNLFLCLAALASGIIESQDTWVDAEGLCELSSQAIVCLSEAVCTEYNLSPDGDKLLVLSGADAKSVRSLEILVSQLLPKILVRLKGILKAGTRAANEDIQVTAFKNDDLPSAIISAHQLRWCLNQVHYPQLKPHAEMVIRTVLIALDHYTPPVKRQAMKSFIHLAKTLSPTELCWFKDPILDAVTRSLIGSEDLWPVAVEMAVALVTKIEGSNMRGRWYRAIMKEMLEDLERHKNDQGRRIVWLQTVTPQFEAMAIVLVAHFKVLLPLLYSWLHAYDETTQLLAFTNLRSIILHTWPRIPFHAMRIHEELVIAYKDAEIRKSGPEIIASIDEVLRLLELMRSAPNAGPVDYATFKPGVLQSR